MGWLGSIKDKIGNLFGGGRGGVDARGRPARGKPQLVGGEGHRGMALGSLGKGKEDVSAENRKKWKRLLGDDAYSFVYEGTMLFVHSSNVVAAQYFIDTEQMMVEFKNRSAYLYSYVWEDDAIAFATAQSKGSFIWDYLRVRGSKTAHKKPWVRIK